MNIVKIVEDKKDKEILNTLINGLNVIKCFDEENQKYTLSDIAKKIDITRASARRILLTLEHEGYVVLQNNYFSLTPRVIELGYSYFSSLPWSDLAYKHMKEFVKESNLSCSLSILDENNIICILRVHAIKILTESIQVGTKLPAAYTATGRLYMCHMEDEKLKEYLSTLELVQYTEKSIANLDDLYKNIVHDRNLGYNVVKEEFEEGLISVSAPIYNMFGHIIGALNVGTYINEKNIHILYEDVIPKLQKAAKATTLSLRQLHL